MNFYDYIGLTPDEFRDNYINTNLVIENEHESFPLNIYNYSRKCIQEQAWDSVTSKCRGVITNRETGEIVARPFEKFHNYGAVVGAYAGADGPQAEGAVGEPVVWEKLDGFMCTLYEWEGVNYVASKGSFHSTHAKWATAELRKKWAATMPFLPKGYTVVFEGLCPSLRIVVNYGETNELRLLAVINNETGEEYLPQQLKGFAGATGFKTPEQLRLTLEEARKESLDEGIVDEEGYVLTWYRAGTTPFRLKMKFIEYLRLHRLVTNVSPKHIWEVLSQGQTAALDEYLNDSTPWFKKFVEKWQRALKGEYRRLEFQAIDRFCKEKLAVDKTFLDAMAKVTLEGNTPYVDFSGLRKEYALAFNKPDNKEFASIMFALLDKKDICPIIWRQVKPMTKNVNPLVNGFAY